MAERSYDLLDRPDVLRVLFHPRPTRPGPADETTRNVRFAVAEGVSVGGRLHVVGQDAPLILLFHGNGEADRIIPVEEGEVLHRRCAAKVKRLVTVPGAGHNDLLFRGRDAYFAAIREFVRGE